MNILIGIWIFVLEMPHVPCFLNACFGWVYTQKGYVTGYLHCGWVYAQKGYITGYLHCKTQQNVLLGVTVLLKHSRCGGRERLQTMCWRWKTEHQRHQADSSGASSLVQSCLCLVASGISFKCASWPLLQSRLSLSACKEWESWGMGKPLTIGDGGLDLCDQASNLTWSFSLSTYLVSPSPSLPHNFQALPSTI